jgi:hypothetical protein
VDIQTAIHNVKAARAAVAAHRHNKPAELQANRTALALAESELREIGKRLGVSICLLEPEPESNEQVCAYLKGWGK